MKHGDYLSVCEWYAWRPVRIKGGGWVWFKHVTKIVDERSGTLLGMIPVVSYLKLKK